MGRLVILYTLIESYKLSKSVKCGTVSVIVVSRSRVYSFAVLEYFHRLIKLAVENRSKSCCSKTNFCMYRVVRKFGIKLLSFQNKNAEKLELLLNYTYFLAIK